MQKIFGAQHHYKHVMERETTVAGSEEEIQIQGPHHLVSGDSMQKEYPLPVSMHVSSDLFSFPENS